MNYYDYYEYYGYYVYNSIVAARPQASAQSQREASGANY